MAAHRYWRLNLLATSGNAFAMAEVQFRATAGVAASMTGGAASATENYQGSPGTYDASHAVDGDASTFWSSQGATLPQFWMYDFGAGHSVDVTEVFIQARSDSYYSQTPSTFRLEYSDDGDTWTPLQLFFAAAWSAGAAQTFDVTSSTVGSRFWRIGLVAVATSLGYGFGEVQFRTAAGTPRPFDGADVTATESYPGTEPLMGVDGSATTFWSSNNTNGTQFFTLDFGVNKKIAAVQLAMTARNDSYFSEAPSQFSVGCSNDGVNWTNMGNFAPAPWTQGATQLFALALVVPVSRPLVFML